MASSVAALQFIRSIGGSIGVVIFQAVLNRYYDPHSSKNTLQDYVQGLQALFLAAFICGLISFVFAFGIQKRDIFVRQPKSSMIKVNATSALPTQNDNKNEAPPQRETHLIA